MQRGHEYGVQRGGVLQGQVDALGADRPVRVRAVAEEDEPVAHPLPGVRGGHVEHGQVGHGAELGVQQVGVLRQDPGQLPPYVPDPAPGRAGPAVRQGPDHADPVGVGVVDQDGAVRPAVHAYAPGGPALRVQREPHHVAGEGRAAPRVDAREGAGLGEPAVGADDHGGPHGDRRPVGAVHHGSLAGAAGTLLQERGDPVPLEGGEAGQPVASGQEFLQHVPLREGEQVVVRGGQAPVVDVEQHLLALQDLHPAQDRRPSGRGSGEGAEFIQDALAAGLQELAVEVAVEPGGTFDECHADAGTQQHERQCEPGGAGADDADVGVELFTHRFRPRSGLPAPR